jgi:hypothetical protein
VEVDGFSVAHELLTPNSLLRNFESPVHTEHVLVRPKHFRRHSAKPESGEPEGQSDQRKHRANPWSNSSVAQLATPSSASLNWIKVLDPSQSTWFAIS